MSDILNIKVPAAFIANWGFPSGAELGYGYSHGWISERDAIQVALAKWQSNVPVTSDEEELALLLSDEVDQVQAIANRLQFADQPAESRARYWLLLTLGWLLDNRETYADPFSLIDLLYADFDYPDEVSPLVGYMPLRPGDAAGHDGILERWLTSVERWRSEYKDRDRRYRNPQPRED